tara:strand:- start:26370 stop:27611 length:1242 start_codon:yes stop_codon:yes gene_type:complete
MKFFIYTIIYFFSISFIYTQDIKQVSYNNFFATSTNELSSASSGELVIKNFQGNISIIGNSENKISVLRKTFLTVFSKDKARLYFENSLNIKDIEEKDGSKTIFIESVMPRTKQLNDNLEIHLPNNFSIVTHCQASELAILSMQGKMNISNHGGNIILEDLSGKFTLLNSDGKVVCTKIRGTMSISTLNGNIQLNHVKGNVNANTSIGHINAKNINGNVIAKTINGKIELHNITGKKIYGQTDSGDLIARDVISTKTIDLHTHNGNVLLENLNGDIEASTTTGEIILRKIKGKSKVWNTTGKIDAQDIFGPFNGKTSFGNISLFKLWNHQYGDHEIDLQTSFGNIDIFLPNNFPANFTVLVRDPGEKPGEVIISDFPLNIKVQSGISSGKGVQSNGLYKVNLETNRGVIKIKS